MPFIKCTEIDNAPQFKLEVIVSDTLEVWGYFNSKQAALDFLKTGTN